MLFRSDGRTVRFFVTEAIIAEMKVTEPGGRETSYVEPTNAQGPGQAFRGIVFHPAQKVGPNLVWTTQGTLVSE